MFSDFDQPEYNLDTLIETQNSGELIKLWSQSSELQEEIASQLFMISDEQAATDIFNFLADRFSQAPDYEKINTISAFHYLGIGNESADSLTTDFLCSSVEKCQDGENQQFAEPMITSLRGKVLSAFLDAQVAEKAGNKIPVHSLEVMSKAKTAFLTVINGDYPKDAKLRAIGEIFRCRYLEDHQDIIDTLKNQIEGGDEAFSKAALGELFFMLDHQDDYLKSHLADRVDNTNPQTATKDELLRIVIKIGWTKDARFIPFLNTLQEQNRFPDDFQYNNYLKEALDEIYQNNPK